LGPFSLVIRRSSIDHPEAGFGVFVEGKVLAGTVLALYPGLVVHSYAIDPTIIQGNEYMVSRYDGIVIDGRNWHVNAWDLRKKNKRFNSCRIGNKIS